MSKNMNVPKLRFKEFSGEWKIKPLSQISGMKAGKFVKASDILDNQEDEMYPCYGGNGLRGYVKSYNHNGIYSLIGRQGALCGNIQLASGKFHATEHAVVVTPTDENDTLWLYYELERLNLNRFATGQAQPGLSVEVIQQVKTNVPSKQEQEKIASFLTSVDTKIEQLTRKEELLQQYKKGVMQKIFSQEIRFKADDGSEFPEWEEKKVSDIFDITRGYVLAVTNMSEVKTDEFNYPVYSSQTKNKGLTGYYNQYLYENSITWTTDGANAGDVNFRQGKFYCTNVCGVLKSDKGYANECIAQILNSVTKKYVSYVGNPKLMNNTMGSIKIFIPSSIKEQTKIANFLSSIDSKIEQVQKQLNSTKEFKKALLQQMLV